MNNKKANTEYTLVKEIEERWSPRAFSSDEIPEKEIHQIFEAARWAASSNNYQPWRFMWTRKGSETWDKVFNCLSDFNQKWVNNATVIILTAYKKQFDSGKENFHALHDLGLAVGNMSVQAQALNIGLHQMAGVDWQKAHEVFNIPEGYHVTTAIVAGYYGGDPSVLPEDLEKSERSERSRKDLTSILFKDSFNL